MTILKSVGLFQDAVYELLKTDAELQKSASGIYLSVQQDAKYPFILLNLLSVQDFSKFDKARLEVEFEICLFSRDKSQYKVLAIADHIIGLVKPERIGGTLGFHILSIRSYKTEFIRGQDLHTVKVILKYKALLGEL